MKSFKIHSNQPLKVVVLILLTINLLFLSTCKEQPDDILTPTERNWLNHLNRELIHAPDPSFPPMEFFDKNDIYQGIAADYLKIICERLQIKVKTIKTENWSEIVEKGKSKQIDFTTVVQRTESRLLFWDFTDTYLTVPNVIIVRSDNQGDIKLKDNDYQVLHPKVVFWSSNRLY